MKSKMQCVNRYNNFTYYLFFVIILINCVFSSIQSEEINNSSSSIKETLKRGDNETTLSNNSRNSRQLFSLLKNFIKQQKQPIQSETQLNPFQEQQQSQVSPQYNYPGGNYYYPSPVAVEQKIHIANPQNSLPQQQNYPLLNYPLQQHSSVPFYNENLQAQQQQQIPQFALPQGGNGNGLTSPSSSPNNILSGVLGGLSGLGIPEDLDLATLANSFANFGSIEGMLGKVNQFDKLQCIPRMICQMVAKRNEDTKLRDSTSTTERTTTTTERSRTKKPKKRTRNENNARFIKINGVDTALDQFVRFLDIMQLKDWSLYPYVKGMYEGNQVKRSSDCAEKFNSCPFSDDQLVYYFNNYNGGFFSSFRSGKGLKISGDIEDEKVTDNKPKPIVLPPTQAP